LPSVAWLTSSLLMLGFCTTTRIQGSPHVVPNPKTCLSPASLAG
jgi:hypothetical protein